MLINPATLAGHNVDFDGALSNFTYIGCHKFRVPLGTAREERSLLWQQSDRIVSAIKADKSGSQNEGLLYCP